MGAWTQGEQRLSDIASAVECKPPSSLDSQATCRGPRVPRYPKDSYSERPDIMAKKSASIASPLNKSQILADISTTTGLAKRDVGKVVEELAGVIERHIGKKGPGQFTLPGLFKIKTIRKPATKARKGINPFTKEEVTFKAKPARIVIKIRPLKKLKDMV